MFGDGDVPCYGVRCVVIAAKRSRLVAARRWGGDHFTAAKVRAALELTTISRMII